VVAVTQGCQPVGPVHTVTRADGLVVAAIDGRPAFTVFAERARPILDDLGRAAQTLFLAVEDEAVIRGVLKFDPDRGLIATSNPIAQGARFRFAVRDGWAARADLRRTAADVAQKLDGRPPRAGFYFQSAGRGRALFGVEDHDVSYLRSALGDFPLIGLGGGGELGPAAGQTRLHLFAGVLAVIP
jgi:small ligand-binding sensory domain FIST